MKTLTVREMRQATPNLERTLAAEGEMLLVSNGKPIARLLPIADKPARSKLPSMKAFRATMPMLERPISEDIRADRDGR